MRTPVPLAALISALCVCHGTAQTEFVTNGGFETGDFTGWSLTDAGAGSWTINDGTVVPPGNGGALAPISGSFDALTAQTGPGTHLSTQCFIVPPVVNSATLTWSDRIRNYAAVFSDPNQEFRVVIADEMGNTIQTVFSTDPGDPLIQIGPNNRSFDVTTLLQGLAGQTVCISFQEQDNLFFFNVTIDDVSLVINTPNFPSRFTTFGEGCPVSQMLYELFVPGTLDLSNTAYTFTPDSFGNYTVTAGGTFDTNLTRSVPSFDDQVLGPFNLGFTFPYGGGSGSTTAVEVSSNGYVYLQPGTIPTSRCCNGSVAGFSAEAESIAVFGQDLNPAAGGQIFVDNRSNPNRTVVTWNGVPEFPNIGSNTAQIQLYESGQIVLAYGSIGLAQHIALVGYSAGNGAEDRGPTDFTADLPTNFTAAGNPLTLGTLASDRPIIGQQFDLEITNIPMNATAGALHLGFMQTAVDLTPIGMDRCTQYAVVDDAVPFAPTPPTQTISLMVPSDAVLLGNSIFTQVAFAAVGANPLGAVASNGGEITFGDF